VNRSFDGTRCERRKLLARIVAAITSDEIIVIRIILELFLITLVTSTIIAIVAFIITLGVSIFVP
jgi:hypothetical protein